MNSMKIYYLESGLKGREVYSNMVIIAKNKEDAIGLSKLETSFYITEKEYLKNYQKSFSYKKAKWRNCYQLKFDINQDWVENPLIICISETTNLEKEIVLSREYISI
jgi:hypothetical protein